MSSLRTQDSVANRGDLTVARKVDQIDWCGLASTAGQGLQQMSQEDSSSGKPGMTVILGDRNVGLISSLWFITCRHSRRGPHHSSNKTLGSLRSLDKQRPLLYSKDLAMSLEDINRPGQMLKLNFPFCETWSGLRPAEICQVDPILSIR